MTDVTVSEARAALPDLLDRVLQGEEFTITRHGRPVAVVLHHAALRARRRSDVHTVAEQLQRTLAVPPEQHSGAPTLSAERTQALLEELRAGREAR